MNEYLETHGSLSFRNLKATNSVAIPSGGTPTVGGMPLTNRYLYYDTTRNTLAVSGLDGNFTYAFNKIQADSLYKGINYVPAWNEITGKPTLFSGAYADLTGKPTLFSGSYNDLTNKPAIVTPSLQGVTDIGNSTDNAIQVTGADNFDPTKLGLVVASNGLFNIRSETDFGSLTWAGGEGEDATVNLTIYPGKQVTFAGTQTIFDSPVTGKAATTSNQFVTLQQLNDAGAGSGGVVHELWLEDFREDGDDDSAVWQKAIIAMETQKTQLNVGSRVYDITRHIKASGDYLNIKMVKGFLTMGTRIRNRIPNKGYIDSAIPVDLSYPTDSNPGVMDGCFLYFTNSPYYGVIEGGTLIDFRFAFAYLRPHNSPVFRDVNFFGCNAGVITYQGCQNYQFYNCGTGNTNTLIITNATAFPVGSPYAGDEGYYTDTLFIKNEDGYGSMGGFNINVHFDNFVRESILRPDVESSVYTGTPGLTFKYRDQAGVVYPSTSDYANPSGWMVFCPSRHGRMLHGWQMKNLDVRGTVQRGWILANAPVDSLLLEGTFMYEDVGLSGQGPKPIMVVGSVFKALNLVQNRFHPAYDSGALPMFTFTGRGNNEGITEDGPKWVTDINLVPNRPFTQNFSNYIYFEKDKYITGGLYNQDTLLEIADPTSKIHIPGVKLGLTLEPHGGTIKFSPGQFDILTPIVIDYTKKIYMEFEYQRPKALVRIYQHVTAEEWPTEESYNLNNIIDLDTIAANPNLLIGVSDTAGNVDNVTLASIVALAGGGGSTPVTTNAKLKEGFGIFNRLMDADRKHVRILIGGTSITANSITGIQNFVDHAKAKWGRAGRTQDMYILGGSYDAPFAGWDKQRAATYSRGRLISTASSQVLKLEEYGRKVVLRYSKETNGKSFEVRVNGVLTATLSCQGPQQYGVTYAYSLPDDVPIQVTITALSGAGVVYLESYDIIRGTKGIIEGNTGLGGSGITNFMPGGMTPEFPIPVVGFAGIDGIFVNPDPDTLPDILILTYMVNEVGLSQRANYESAYNRIVQSALQRNVSVVICTEAAGIFSVAAAGGKTDYDSMVVYLKSLADKYPNVTFLDWNERLGLTTTDLPTLQTLMNRYYSGTVDVVTGAQSGDVIHCNPLAYAIQAEMFCKVAGLPYQGYKRPLQAMDMIENNRFRVIPNLHPANRNWFKTRYGTFDALTNRKAQCKYELIGQSVDITASPTPLWRGTEEYNLEQSVTSQIAASATSDKYGKYVTYETNPEYIPMTFNAAADDESFVTLTIIGVDVRWGFYGPRAGGMTTILDGREVSIPLDYPFMDFYGGLNLDRTNMVDTIPTCQHYTIKRKHTTSPNISGNLYGKIYGIYITETAFPCIPGNKSLENPMTPLPLMLGMTGGGTVLPNQRFADLVNGKRLIKVSHAAKCVNINSTSTGALEPTYIMEKGDILWEPSFKEDTVGGFQLVLNSDGIIPPQGYNTTSYIYGLSDLGTNTTDNYVLSGMLVSDFPVEVYIRTGGASDFFALQPNGTFSVGGTSQIITNTFYKGVTLCAYIKLKFPNLVGRDDWYMEIKQAGVSYSMVWVLSEGSKYLM